MGKKPQDGRARLARWRALGETYRGVRWHRRNRLDHEQYRTDPRFSAACKLDGSRILKRPDRRYSDGRQLAIASRREQQRIYLG
jgi:hypothetical protein